MNDMEFPFHGVIMILYKNSLHLEKCVKDALPER